MEKSSRKKIFTKNFIIFTVAIIAIIVTSIIIRYSVEGETNLPFQVSKIMIISNAGRNPARFWRK